MAEPAYRALLIGNSDFPCDPHNLQNLHGPVNDIALLRDALTDPTTGLFAPHDVRLLPERTMSQILIEVEQFFSSAHRTDRLLVYYSGHGLLNYKSELFLAARDTRSDALLSTSVSAAVINDIIDSSPAGATIIILDCCYSGAFKSGDLPRSLQGVGRYLLTSTRSSQLANDADLRNTTSLFTTYLVEGLRGGADDRDGDGFVDLDDIYGYVYRRMAERSLQVPQRRFSGDGGVTLARRPIRSHAGAAASSSPTSPSLTLSRTAIDLGEVSAADVIPPERIAVINRGGGRVDWTASSNVDWIQVHPDGDNLLLYMRPKPGQNVGTVLVESRGTGETEAISVRVSVRPQELPTAAPLDDEASHSDPRSRSGSGWLITALGSGLVVLVASFAMVRTGGMATLLWILAVVLVIAGIVAIVRKQLLWGIVLIFVGLLVGPGGISIFT